MYFPPTPKEEATGFWAAATEANWGRFTGPNTTSGSDWAKTMGEGEKLTTVGLWLGDFDFDLLNISSLPARECGLRHRLGLISLRNKGGGQFPNGLDARRAGDLDNKFGLRLNRLISFLPALE